MNMVRLIKGRATMRCSKAGKYFSPYIDGELGARERALLESHLAQCGKCAGEFEKLKRLHSLFLQAERFSAPCGFSTKVMERAAGHPAKPFSLIPVFIRVTEGFAIVLAIAMGIMSGGMLISAFAPHQKTEQVAASLSLESFESLPSDSLGRAYLAMTEDR